MPKQRITKEMILEVAFKLARERGYEQVVVKNIAAEMGCSVQPICPQGAVLPHPFQERGNTGAEAALVVVAV